MPRKKQFAGLSGKFRVVLQYLACASGQSIDLSYPERSDRSLNRLGTIAHHALFLHHYVSCLVCNGKYHEAHWVQQELTAMADRLGDPASQSLRNGKRTFGLRFTSHPSPTNSSKSKKRTIEGAT